MHQSPAPTTVIVVPTYNEAENIDRALDAVLSALPDAHVLVVDDASPDGTGRLADARAERDGRVHVLHRTAKDGLGAAYLAGFDWALDAGFAVVGQFDADGSHPASALPDMRRALEDDPDVWTAIGSRWVAGGSIEDWPRSREILSRGGNAYARGLLALPVRDATAGFRLYRADALRAVHLGDVHSKGYCFQIDLTLRVHDAGGRFAEVPIRFRERRHGTSKMSSAIVAEAMLYVTVQGLRRRAAAILGAIIPRSRRTPRRRPRS